MTTGENTPETEPTGEDAYELDRKRVAQILFALDRDDREALVELM